jgi:hypothetical protein
VRDGDVTEASIEIGFGLSSTAQAVSNARRLLQVQTGALPKKSAVAKQAAPAEQPIAMVAPPASTATAAPIEQPAVIVVPLPAPAPAEIAANSHAPAARQAGNPRLYSAVCALVVIAGIAAVWTANRLFAPEMYDYNGMVPVAEAFARNENYAVFDLNLNIRRLRDEHIARLTRTPDVVVLGASHWQEAHSSLVKHKQFYNSHIHRDYWEDMLGVTEMFVRHNRLPKQMIISIRDNLFVPIEARKDFLWEPGIPYWRAMADRMGLEKEAFWKSLPYQRTRERFSLAMLFNNLTRWYNADEKPHATTDLHFKSLDTLLPGGSILWSADHQKIFTRERTERETAAFLKVKLDNPPKIEQRGVETIDKLLSYLKAQGVEVYLAHPPFNPMFYDGIAGSSYAEGLEKIKQITRDLAAKHGLNIIGSFNPHDVGCDASMYIDAEHGNPECLQKIFDQFTKLDTAKGEK